MLIKPVFLIRIWVLDGKVGIEPTSTNTLAVLYAGVGPLLPDKGRVFVLQNICQGVPQNEKTEQKGYMT